MAWRPELDKGGVRREQFPITRLIVHLERAAETRRVASHGRAEGVVCEENQDVCPWSDL